MGRRGLLSAVLAAGLLIAGCGGGDDTVSAPTFTGTDEEQIAGTVNAMTAAIAAGDGVTACVLMTERGQGAFARLARQVPVPGGGERAESCEGAAQVLADNGYDPGDFRITTKDVELDAGDPDRAWAACDLRGAFRLMRTTDGWRVDIPYCVD